ncbi:methyl-accepting chemotaxis protein [Actinoplanes sp. NPDC049316]|uniref:methyl-accepting chemotaxis protein n=1 Tax=Actinoplanes sp. NPDC049316 TaxID=3154727 RepID=UPI003424B88C
MSDTTGGTDATVLGDQPARRRPSDDVSISGRLVGPLYGASGVSMVLYGLTTRSEGHGWVIVGGSAATVIAGIGFALDWSRVPRGLARAMPYIALVMLCAVGLGCPDAVPVTTMSVAMALMWGGVALDLVDLVGLAVGAIPTVALPLALHTGPATVVRQTVVAVIVVTAIGGAMHWLRRQLDAAQARGVQAQADAAAAMLAQQREREESERVRAASAAAELAERTALQDKVSTEATSLAGAAATVSDQAGAAAQAVSEMSRALRELSETAHASDRIAGIVADRAQQASDVMAALAGSSKQIMAASDVIQGIAAQTNLLALNATIEAARAGDLGKGFAVVAGEVKDLARQSGENADAITRTLDEVQAQVDAAVTRVAEITASMGELGAQNQTLAAAIEEQSATVATVSGNVSESATQARRIADGVRELEQISRAG